LLYMSSPDLKTAVIQEEAYLRLVHPTPEEVPGCMSLFDDFLSCNGAKKVNFTRRDSCEP